MTFSEISTLKTDNFDYKNHNFNKFGPNNDFFWNFDLKTDNFDYKNHNFNKFGQIITFSEI